MFKPLTFYSYNKTFAFMEAFTRFTSSRFLLFFSFPVRRFPGSIGARVRTTSAYLRPLLRLEHREQRHRRYSCAARSCFSKTPLNPPVGTCILGVLSDPDRTDRTFALRRGWIVVVTHFNMQL